MIHEYADIRTRALYFQHIGLSNLLIKCYAINIRYKLSEHFY